HKLCAEPREDPLLTVTYAYLEKGATVQAISGPFDLGRPLRCKPDGYSGWTRLSPKAATTKHSKKHGKHNKHRRGPPPGSAEERPASGWPRVPPGRRHLYRRAPPQGRARACCW
ncbi:MAG TPA: hypothetical protein VFI66_05745, partial [Gemmatimonadales bacterium]|nr:hypothetical protein [Gemmatimonadales bacterium]